MFNIFSQREPPKILTVEEAFEADKKALESDWEKVANDFKKVFSVALWVSPIKQKIKNKKMKRKR